MTNIVVLIKQVPDTWSERKLSDGDYTLDREAADAVLDEINERAVEEALQIREREGGEGSVMGGVLGVLFIALVQNAMIINGVGIFWQNIIVGLVLLLAVSLDRFKQTSRS